jgi:hypothetical protein
MPEVLEQLTAKQAIEVAFRLFREFFEPGPKPNALLEGLEFVEGKAEWVVTIGFDTGRVIDTRNVLEKSDPFAFASGARQAVREARAFHLGANDGKLLKMVKV